MSYCDDEVIDKMELNCLNVLELIFTYKNQWNIECYMYFTIEIDEYKICSFVFQASIVLLVL